MTCRWCTHETILTEDASPLLSALVGANSPQQRQQAQQQAMVIAAMKPCSKCGAYQTPLTGGMRPDGSGWALWQNPDDSVWLEVLGPLKDGKARTVRWEMRAGNYELGATVIPARGWVPTVHETATMGKRDAVGTPWTPPAVSP